ncbi:MAG: ATP-grasp domain-containing protein [Phycisphaerales bacterium]|nr:MAG: ATP-grasp domain-containing protein [Phycisphaerales bacterium]
MRLLFSCVGRRVELVQAFLRAGEALGVELEIHGADSNGLAPALQWCHKRHIVPRIPEDNYIPVLLGLVQAEKIDVMVPLIDHELEKLSGAHEEFEAVGCRPIISSPDVVHTCRDKLLTHKYFTQHDIDTPKTWTAKELLQGGRTLSFPYFLKPRFGSAGLGNHRLETLEAMRALSQQVPEPIVQEYVEGVEHTLDAYTGLDGKLRCVLARRRLEVRGGEVTKSLLVMDPELIEAGSRVINSRSGWMGVITIQCIQRSDGRIQFIEVNPRFGGGVPLSIRAGADFPRWLLMELCGDEPDVRPDSFTDGLTMSRYDQSVFLNESGSLFDAPPQEGLR